jgi:hypothetical protein
MRVNGVIFSRASNSLRGPLRTYPASTGYPNKPFDLPTITVLLPHYAGYLAFLYYNGFGCGMRGLGASVTSRL